MSEYLPSPIETEEQSDLDNERFGKEEVIVQALREGEARVVGHIDELFPEVINKHRNVVDIAELDLGEYKADVANKSETVQIEGPSGESLLAVFKPASGEDEEIKAELSHSMYPREYVAYLISRHFNFNLVPPTVIREIDGEVGSLQLFMPPPAFLPGRKVMDKLSDQDYDLLEVSEDMKKLALLDHILANPDRHQDNYLLKVDSSEKLSVGGDHEPTIIAIDHGISLNERYYRQSKTFNVFNGPYQFLSYDNLKRQPKSVQIPDHLLAGLQHGIEHRDLLEDHLKNIPEVGVDEVNSIWNRVGQLVKRKIFLSPLNI